MPWCRENGRIADSLGTLQGPWAKANYHYVAKQHPGLAPRRQKSSALLCGSHCSDTLCYCFLLLSCYPKPCCRLTRWTRRPRRTTLRRFLEWVRQLRPSCVQGLQRSHQWELLWQPYRLSATAFGKYFLATMRPRHASALKPSRQVNTVARITVTLPACD